MINPSQSVRAVTLPRVHQLQPALREGRVQFRDAGFVPTVTQSPGSSESNEVKLGPEQLAVVGYGEYAKPKYDLGIQEDVLIPQNIRPVPCELHSESSNSVSGTLSAHATGDLRIIVRQFAQGKPFRSSRGAPPNGTSLDRILRIEVVQNGASLPVHLNYDKALWSGLSWAVAEVNHKDLRAGVPLIIRCTSLETQSVELKVETYAVAE